MTKPRPAREVEIMYAPINGWLHLLLDGWRPVNLIAEPMLGSHGAWSIMLERESRRK